MIQYINHRINTIQHLKDVPLENGIELDIRYHNDDLILHHDPFSHHTNIPEKFEDFLKHWQHKGPMILNVKTEGVELRCIELMNHYNVKNWFFLDLSMPFFTIYAEKAQNGDIKGFSIDNLAVRFSEREPIEYALAFKGKAKWVWVDCFTHMPLTKENAELLQNAGYKICLVSPELQKHNLDQIATHKQMLQGISYDAVCTKRPDLWEK